jgi:hypothetical protein
MTELISDNKLIQSH